jgi:hypothetical protein
MTRNKYNYERYHSQRHPSLLPSPLPTLEHLATLPLPTTTLFFEAFRGELDESELPQWDLLETYTSPRDQLTQFSHMYTKNLIQVMHGRRLRLQQEDAAVRFAIYRDKGLGELRSSIVEEARSVLQEWRVIEGVLGNFKEGSCYHEMAQHILQWKSKKFCELRGELDALDAGGDATYQDTIRKLCRTSTNKTNMA